jgi:hypothetical protein
MTSVTNSSGLNYQNGINPLGRKVRALESDVDTLKKELLTLKGGAPSGGAGQQKSAEIPPSFLAEFEAMKRELATIKAAGYGKGEKGEKGDRGERGEKGDKGDAGPMTYIAMPPQMMAPSQPVAASVPTAASVLG